MKKFNYIKWVTENKYGKGLLSEQTGSTCMEIQAQVCGGSTTVTWPCSTIGGQLPTLGSVGSTVGANQGDWEITAVNPPTSSPYGTQDFQITGTGCPGTGSLGCPGCNSGNHTWNNLQNWINNFNNLGPFSSSNPNQPCQFLNNKIAQWTNIQQGLGGCNAYYNQLECKIKHATILHQQNNC